MKTEERREIIISSTKIMNSIFCPRCRFYSLVVFIFVVLIIILIFFLLLDFLLLFLLQVRERSLGVVRRQVIRRGGVIHQQPPLSMATGHPPGSCPPVMRPVFSLILGPLPPLPRLPPPPLRQMTAHLPLLEGGHSMGLKPDGPRPYTLRANTLTDAVFNRS